MNPTNQVVNDDGILTLHLDGIKPDALAELYLALMVMAQGKPHDYFAKMAYKVYLSGARMCGDGFDGHIENARNTFRSVEY
jgi:hypothetical protein